MVIEGRTKRGADGGRTLLGRFLPALIITAAIPHPAGIISALECHRRVEPAGLRPAAGPRSQLCGANGILHSLCIKADKLSRLTIPADKSS